MSLLSGNFVSVRDCLDASLEKEQRVVFIDGSWHLDKSRSARSEFEAGPRIANARFFDIDDIATKDERNLPHMMPPKNLFEAAMDALEIMPEDRLVIYGTEGCMFTSRAWYTFRSMGHDSSKVHLMQGSLKDWQELNGPIETGHSTKYSIYAKDLPLSQETKYKTTKDLNGNMVSKEDVYDIINKVNSNAILVDARSSGRFYGTAPEPREGLRGGHMPGAFNVPATDVLDKPNQFKNKDQLMQIFKKAGISPGDDTNIVCSCGSGVTACIVAAALEECGHDPNKTLIYDGSWIEWGSDPNTPITTEK